LVSAVGDLTLIAFYSLLRIGKWFQANCPVQNGGCDFLPEKILRTTSPVVWMVSDDIILSADSEMLKLDNKKR
jgi:hypothetical protein